MATTGSPSKRVERRNTFASGAESDLPLNKTQETFIAPEPLWVDVQQALAGKKGKKEEVARKFREFISNKKLSQKTLKGLVVHLSDLKKSLGDKIENTRDTILTVCKECLPEDEPEDNPPSPPEDTPPSSQQIEGNGKRYKNIPKMEEMEETNKERMMMLRRRVQMETGRRGVLRRGARAGGLRLDSSY